MNLVQNIIAQTAFQSYYSLISNLLVQAPWNQLLDFNPIIVLFLTLIPAIHQDLRIDFNPIIVLFLTLKHNKEMFDNRFQSYYSLISNFFHFSRRC